MADQIVLTFKASSTPHMFTNVMKKEFDLCKIKPEHCSENKLCNDLSLPDFLYLTLAGTS
jgi:hypothetical protein